MFEEMTYEKILRDVLDNAPDGIDTRQGSIFYDAVAGPCLKIAKLYTDIGIARKMASIATATGDDLDDKADEYGVTRHAATPAKYRFSFEGTTPDTGTRFYNDGRYFLLRYNTLEGEYYLEAEVPGEAGNVVYAGTAAIPVNEIEGLKNAKFGEIYENGADREKDESLRTRVQEKIAGPAENGNKQHYKTWCESIDGIGHARIYPLWNGPNTVKAVLIDSSGRACSSSKIAEVQNYIDPATNGYTATPIPSATVWEKASPTLAHTSPLFLPTKSRSTSPLKPILQADSPRKKSRSRRKKRLTPTSKILC